MEFPREKPRSKPGNEIQAAPGGRIIQFDSLIDKSLLSGEVSMLGVIDTPSIHCRDDKACGAKSSPTVQGTLINANLIKMINIKNILRADRFFSHSLTVI